MKSVKKYLGGLLAFVLIFTLAVQPSGVNAEKPLPSNVEVLENNSEVIKLKTTIDGVTGILSQDQSTYEITLTTLDTRNQGPEALIGQFSSNVQSVNEENILVDKKIESSPVKQYEIILNDYVADSEKFKATYHDKDTGEKILDDPTAIRPHLVWFAPIGVIIGQFLLEQLLAIGTAVVIGSLTWAAAESVAMSLRNRQDHDHYAARIMQNDVWVGPSISLSQATIRLTSFNGDADALGNDVWSRTQSLAAKVAKIAGGGRNEPVGPEIHGVLGRGYYYHFHTWNRVGGHSFF
jgi:hypothetical protein